MQHAILKIIEGFRTNKIPISKVEKDLGFSNGLIGKSAKGACKLSQEKFDALEKYFLDNCGIIARANYTFTPEMEVIGQMLEFNQQNARAYEKKEITVPTSFDALRSMFRLMRGSEVPPPTVSPKPDEPTQDVRLLPDWAIKIEAYCNEAGVTPEELIDAHKTPKKTAKEKKSEDKGNNQSSGNVYDRRKNKLGF